MEAKTPLEVRKACRSSEFKQNTSGLCKGYVQANLVILPQKYSDDFKLFCERNPKPCPLLEMTQPGRYEVSALCPSGIDFRRDFPLYKVFKNGEFQYETPDVSEIWREDMVSFLLGCSFSFEEALE